MQAHRARVVIPGDHRLTIDLPSDFPAGEAEVIVLATAPAAAPPREPFGVWLDNLRRNLPPAPDIPLEALRRENLYEDD